MGSSLRTLNMSGDGWQIVIKVTEEGRKAECETQAEQIVAGKKRMKC